MRDPVDQIVAELLDQLQATAGPDAWTFLPTPTSHFHEQALLDRLAQEQVGIPYPTFVTPTQLALLVGADRAVWWRGVRFPRHSGLMLVAWTTHGRFALADNRRVALGTPYRSVAWAPPDDDPETETLRFGLHASFTRGDIVPWATGAQLRTIRDRRLAVFARLEDGGLLAVEHDEDPVVLDAAGRVDRPRHVRLLDLEVELPFLTRR